MNDDGRTDRFVLQPFRSSLRLADLRPRARLLAGRHDDDLTTGGVTGVTITRDGRGNTITQTFRDSAGVTLVQTTVDSARRDTARIAYMVTRDSATAGRDSFRVTPRDSFRIDTTAIVELRKLLARRDSVLRLNSTWQLAGPRAGMQVYMGGLLTSGIASMTKTLNSYFLGELKDYNVVIDMTKTTGWK